jgi:hypothetical protein
MIISETSTLNLSPKSRPIIMVHVARSVIRSGGRRSASLVKSNVTVAAFSTARVVAKSISSTPATAPFIKSNDAKVVKGMFTILFSSTASPLLQSTPLTLLFFPLFFFTPTKKRIESFDTISIRLSLLRSSERY